MVHEAGGATRIVFDSNVMVQFHRNDRGMSAILDAITLYRSPWCGGTCLMVEVPPDKAREWDRPSPAWLHGELADALDRKHATSPRRTRQMLDFLLRKLAGYL
jgi:hypothetical protein